MTVKAVDKNTEHLTVTITSEFDAPVDKVWGLWADPRLLERWWGPPTYPATMVDHDLSPGGTVTYFMTGPEGDKHHGWWRIASVDAPHSLEFQDGFADDAGKPAENGGVNDAAWTYRRPWPLARRIKNHVAFGDPVDVVA